MSDETTVGREPLQIVEIEQPACVNTYGSAPCTAAVGDTGTRKCFNTRASCQDPTNYDPDFTIFWRFCKPAAVLPRDIYAESGGEYVKTHPIPSLVSVTTNPTKINVGGSSKNTSPLGRRATVSITLQDHLWDDSVGDFSVDERDYDPLERGTFWSKWLVRNPYHTRNRVLIYDGYVGQSLGEMQQRLYILDHVDGPSSDRVVLVAKDPLRLADDKRTQFPAVSDIVLINAGGINDTVTTGIEVSCIESELTNNYGNTSSSRYLRIDDEILKYTGHYASGTNEWTLTGVTRGKLGTAAAEHDQDEMCQRVGRYESLEVWNIAENLLLNHTSIDSDFINTSQWDDEGNAFLAPFTLSGTVAEPTPVVTLLGELTEQCPFYLWWDEREQLIPIRAIRPPIGEDVESLTDDSHILRDSSVLREDHNQRISRIFLYYDQRDPTRPDKEISNYRSVRGRIDADAESDDEHGDVRIRQIFSRWLMTAPQAIQTTTRLLARFRNAVQTLSVKIDAKDRDIATADVLEVTTRVVCDETGLAAPSLWQVIALEEVVSGETIRLDMHRFEFLGRFWIWASETAPDYSVANDTEREENAYWSDDDGSPGDDDFGYEWV
jgi:hypothetical protein